MSALLPDPPKSSWLPFIGLSSALHVGGLVVVPALLGLAWWQSDVSPKGAPLPPLRVGVVLAKDKDAPKPNPNVQEESESNIEPSESLEPWPLTEPNADSTDWTRLEPAFAQSPKPIMATDSPPLIWEWPKEPESENAEPELQAVQKEETKPEPPGEPQAEDWTPTLLAEHCPEPNYPSRARRQRWQGTALVLLKVHPDGHVLEVRVLESSGHAILDEEAKRALAAWRFAPGPKGVLPSEVRRQVRFQLPPK